jgi:hypothetical protein
MARLGRPCVGAGLAGNCWWGSHPLAGSTLCTVQRDGDGGPRLEAARDGGHKVDTFVHEWVNIVCDAIYRYTH